MKTALILLFMFSAVSFAEGTLDNTEKTVAFSLVAVDGQDGGYCVLKGSKDSVDLITTEGALSEKQLKQALRYMSYRAQLLNASFLLLLPITAAGSIISFVGGSIYPAMIYIKEQESPSAAALQIVAGGWFGPVMEFLHRRDRFLAIVNDRIDFIPESELDDWWKRKPPPQKYDNILDRIKTNLMTVYGSDSTLGVGEVKGEKIIERLQVEPEFPGGCDHLDN